MIAVVDHCTYLVKTVDLLILSRRNAVPMLGSAMMLSRERLHRILAVIQRQGGSETVRQLTRRFSIFRSEIKEAEALGWISIEKRKPKTGRPATIARLSKSQPAKLPPPPLDAGTPDQVQPSQIREAHGLRIHQRRKQSRRIPRIHRGLSANVSASEKQKRSLRKLQPPSTPSPCFRCPPMVLREYLWRNPRHWNFPNYESIIWQHLEVCRSRRAKYKPTSTHRYTESRW